MALLFCSRFDDPVEWSGHLRRLMPELEVRVWPETGDPAAIEAALVWKAPEGELAKYPNLKLIVNLGAGVDSIVADRSIPAGIPIVRIADPEMSRMMAQFVLLAVLRHHRNVVAFERAQRERRWQYIHPRETRETTVGIMGLGHLGAVAAAELVRQGFAVRGWSRTPKTLEGVRSFHGVESLPGFLDGVNVLVAMLPYTPQTDGMIDARVFSMLARGACFVSVGRGRTVDEDALVAALRIGQVGEATLDVFREEPLAPAHPLYTFDQVLVTPHLASVAIPRSAAEQVVENIRRVRDGRPLLNQVDPQRGY
ncbi:MAG: glyoxylate/hydroxypyruvate reductase A [Betaproteobacteria bacterium]|nr:glyoxylate/hydroxypyruvate reductase A [Betaproteobacteria bacterium]